LPDNISLRDLTVAIPTCDDDPEVLALALDAVRAESLPQPALIVDMSHSNAVRHAASAHSDSVRYVSYPESSGTSDSRNRLVELADTRYLLFLDADAVPRPGWAQVMRRGLDRDERIAIVGARCLPVWPGPVPTLFDAGPTLDMLGMLDLGSEPLEVPRIMGTSYALDRERVPDPPFPTSLGRRPRSLLAAEEVNLCLAVTSAGWRVFYEPEAIVDHYVRRERLSWRWMLRRAFVAGRESRRIPDRLEPLPRPRTARDMVVLAAIAPWYLAGRLRGWT
jgi:cellulose synthase/poly-beta-1,6-N-acetylglucosamine synthase-like glycosyltransferase